MNSSCSLGLVREQGRRPFLQSVAFEVKSTLMSGNYSAGCDQRISFPLAGRNEAVGLAFSQSERIEYDALRCGHGDQLAKN